MTNLLEQFLKITVYPLIHFFYPITLVMLLICSGLNDYLAAGAILPSVLSFSLHHRSSLFESGNLTEFISEGEPKIKS